MSEFNDQLRAYIQERMLIYNSSIDTSAGSAFDRTVIQPLLIRLGPDPTDTDAEQIIVDRLNAHDPSIKTERGSAVRDHYITPLTTALEPVRRLIRLVMLRSSWENVEYLSEEEADKLAENVFYERDRGSYATVSIRMKFASPRDVSVTPLNVAYAGTLRFLPSRTQSISRTQMAAQTDGSYYYMDITLISEKSGTIYNIPRNSISAIDGVTGVVSIQQPYAASSGRDYQDNLELRDAVRASLSTRNLVTKKSLRTVLPDIYHFPNIGYITVVGRLDPAMTRDIVWGPASINGIPGGVKSGMDPDLVYSRAFHIGGFTDVWISPDNVALDAQQAMDVRDLKDEGEIVFSSTTGFVSAGTPGRLEDDRAFFTEKDEGFLPVAVGDILYVQTRVLAGEHIEYTVTAVSDLYLDVVPDISAISLSNLSYEVRRRRSNYLQLSIDTLVAVDASNNPLVDSNGDPYLPAPGPGGGSEGVLSVVNRCATNVSLPLLYIERIEFLNPLTGEPTGVVVPEADPICFYVSDQASANQSWVRALYRQPTRFFTEQGQRYYTQDSLNSYIPCEVTGSAATVIDTGSSVSDIIDIAGAPATTPYSLYSNRAVAVGDLITYYNPATPTVAVAQGMIVATNVGGFATRYQVEFAVFPYPGLPGMTARITQGVQAASMGAMTDGSGFYSFDFLCQIYGASTRQDVGTTLALPSSSINSQGWRVLPRLEGYSFSIYEEPILCVTSVVNDSTAMTGQSVRITYWSTPLIQQVQTFLNTDEETVPAEDILARRMPPARVHTVLSFEPDANNIPAKDTVVADLTTYIDTWVDNASDAHYGSATRLSNVAEGLGAVRVGYPFSTIVEHDGKARAGKYNHGKLMSFHSNDGFIVPATVSTAISTLYQLAQFFAGVIVAEVM
jgi:hypothetical protein